MMRNRFRILQSGVWLHPLLLTSSLCSPTTWGDRQCSRSGNGRLKCQGKKTLHPSLFLSSLSPLPLAPSPRTLACCCQVLSWSERSSCLLQLNAQGLHSPETAAIARRYITSPCVCSWASREHLGGEIRDRDCSCPLLQSYAKHSPCTAQLEPLTPWVFSLSQPKVGEIRGEGMCI